MSKSTFAVLLLVACLLHATGLVVLHDHLPGASSVKVGLLVKDGLVGAALVAVVLAYRWWIAGDSPAWSQLTAALFLSAVGTRVLLANHDSFSVAFFVLLPILLASASFVEEAREDVPPAPTAAAILVGLCFCLWMWDTKGALGLPLLAFAIATLTFASHKDPNIATAVGFLAGVFLIENILSLGASGYARERLFRDLTGPVPFDPDDINLVLVDAPDSRYLLTLVAKEAAVLSVGTFLAALGLILVATDRLLKCENKEGRFLGFLCASLLLASLLLSGLRAFGFVQANPGFGMTFLSWNPAMLTLEGLLFTSLYSTVRVVEASPRLRLIKMPLHDGVAAPERFK